MLSRFNRLQLSGKNQPYGQKSTDDIMRLHDYAGSSCLSIMSKEQLKAFIEKIKGDANLQEKLKAANSPDEVISIAKEHGHEFTSNHMSDLSEDDLEKVAGGSCLGNPGWDALSASVRATREDPSDCAKG